jgi:lipopolysaccharide transport system ATP-binding protein
VSEPIISVERVSMAYRIYAKPADMLREALFGGVRHDTFWALRDVSLRVGEKQRVGIVGPNGAGKSTLLQIIAGNLQPSGGTVSVRGRISSLLSLAPAWNSEASGLENIRFNLLMQGVAETRIPLLVDEIVDFTELGPFIFHPVKTYSSGMSARLSFAIATAIEPDVLIIDEVLGTGDGYFAGKAYRRMTEFCARGRALLFVSHSLAAVQQLCNSVIWLQNGAIRLIGDAEYVLKQYELDFRRTEDEAMRTKHIASCASRAAQISPDEVPEGEVTRFRIVAEPATYLSATHFVRAIRIHGLGAEPVEVPLELADIAQEGQGLALDVLGSEWGRIHERSGITCRLLMRITGRRPGGHFVVKHPLLAFPGAIRIEIEAAAIESGERLALEMLDMGEGCWRSLEKVEWRSLPGGWQRLAFTGLLARVQPEQGAKTAAAIIQHASPDVEIREVYLTVGGERTLVVKEREDFELCVRVMFRRPPELADIGVKLSRADGVYVFWQSSGLSDCNLVSPHGEKIVCFRFAPNDLGSGEYYCNAQVSDGWRYPENYPFAQVFARMVDALRFRVIRELSEVDFGVLNQRLLVEVFSVDGRAEEAVLDATVAE